MELKTLEHQILVFHQFRDSFFDIINLRQNKIFNLRRIRDKRIGCADSFNGRVEVFKQFVADSRRLGEERDAVVATVARAVVTAYQKALT